MQESWFLPTIHDIMSFSFPTLNGSHFKEDLHLHIPKILNFMQPFSISMTVLAVVATFSSIVFLAKWIRKYRLRYLLRVTCLLFAILHFLNLICSYQTNICACAASHSQRHILSQGMLVLMLLMAVIRYHWGIPFNIIMNYGKFGLFHMLGFAPFHKQSVHHLGKGHITERRDRGDIPPVYPNGWIPLLESSELQRGEVVSVSALGQRFCVYRGAEGQAYVLDAYCPHLGADLSAGGKVIGECIECPFHFWRFSGHDGACTSIPYANRIPDVVRAKVWPSCEVNTFIFVWHHAEGEEPSWEVPIIPSIQNGAWIFRGRTSHETHCHIQEIPENPADMAHFDLMHSRSILLGQCWMEDGSLLNALEHEWQPSWRPDEKRPHVSWAHLSHMSRLFGFSLPPRFDIDIETIGPAYSHFHIQSWFGKAIILGHVIPEGPLRHRLVQLLFTEPGIKQFPADLLLLLQLPMLERDLLVWNKKQFLQNPILVKEDRKIVHFRRWYSQFYSKNSPTLQSLRDRTLEW